MNKVLITGYMHSGTTMLMILLRAHPQVGWIEMEESFIEYDKPKEWLVMMAKKKVPEFNKKVWGEKIPWGWNRHEVKARRAIGFSKKWLKYFGRKARILHILRHPIDIASSGHGDGNVRKRVIEDVVPSVPYYIDFLNNCDERCTTIVFEELVTKPEIYMSKIFEFINVDADKKTIDKVINTDLDLKFNKININRAYAFENAGVNSDIDYEKLIGKVKRKL